jgi:hypothetical protein
MQLEPGLILSQRQDQQSHTGIEMAAPSTLAQILLYFAAGTSALTALGHTKMGYDLVFPSLKKCGPKDNGALAAKIGWMEVNQGFVIMCKLCSDGFATRTPSKLCLVILSCHGNEPERRSMTEA